MCSHYLVYILNNKLSWALTACEVAGIINSHWSYDYLEQVLNSIPAVSESTLSAVTLGKMASAASMPLFIAVWVPLIFGTFMKPGLQPMSIPPGKVSFGIDWTERGQKFMHVINFLVFYFLRSISHIGLMQCILSRYVFTLLQLLSHKAFILFLLLINRTVPTD